MCGGLERQSGTGLRYLLTITLALVGDPGIYHFPTFFVRGRLSRGIYHFLRSLYVAGYPEDSVTFLRSLYEAGYLEESITITFLRWLVEAFSSSPLFSVGVGPMSVLSMLSPLLPERQWYDVVWPTSIVVLRKNKCGQSRPYRASTNSVPLSVGTVKVRSFSDSVYLRCSLTLRQFRALHKGTGHTFSLARVPPRRPSGVKRVTLRSLEIHSPPLPSFYCKCMLDVRSRPRDYGWCTA